MPSDEGFERVPWPRLTVAGVLRDAARLYRLLFWRSLLITAAIFLVFDLPTAALDVLPDEQVTVTVASIALALFTTYGELLLEGLLSFDVLDLHEGRPEPSLSDLLRRTRPFLVPLAIGTLVYAIGFSLALLLFVVPALLLATRWSVIVPVIVIEHRGVRAAFGRSNRLVRGQTFPVFVVVVLLFVGEGLLEVFVDNLFGWLPEFYAHWIGGFLASAIGAPYVAHALAVVYYRLADPARPVVDFSAVRSS